LDLIGLEKKQKKTKNQLKRSEEEMKNFLFRWLLNNESLSQAALYVCMSNEFTQDMHMMGLISEERSYLN
jgi:hypothetical protein